MAKLTGKKKAEFLRRMARGRKKTARKAHKPKAKKNAKRIAKSSTRKNRKLTGKKKAEFLRRMERGRKKAGRGNPKKRKPAKKKKAAKKKASPARSRRPRAMGEKSRRRGRRNQEGMTGAERMFETFHQKAPGRVLTYREFMNYPDSFAEMGKLKELRFYLDRANPNAPLTNFGADCLAVCTPDGQNIYFVGGDQSVDIEALGIASSKDFVELGPCTYIRYHTVKGFHDFEPTNYYHHFGEEDKILPTLVYDRLNQALFLTSGNYRVERAGIVN